MKKLLLMILDGWGISENSSSSAIYHAKTPFLDSCYKKYSYTQLQTSGLSVGLPQGQMGNSEVGHMNLGAGRIVYQNLTKINQIIKNGVFNKNIQLRNAFQYAKLNNKNVHFIGLLSDGGIHSHIDHLFSLLDSAFEHGIVNIFVHVFTDGRDTDPMSGVFYLNKLLKYLDKTTGKLATVIGRYYAMDRDQRWSRIKKSYDLMVKGVGEKSIDIIPKMKSFYSQGITDEFIEPIVMTDAQGIIRSKIEIHDLVVCFNFRADRVRQITQVLTQQDFLKEEMKKLDLYYLTMTSYHHSYKNIKILFEKDDLVDTLGEVLEKNHKTQIRIAETEKYPHVTFFFSGGRENPFHNETRILCPSPKVSTYDLQPAMSAINISHRVISTLHQKIFDFICLNFANPDMVGHTGIMPATIKACETVDQCAKRICKVALANDYALIILSDHGNAEYMINTDNTPNTSHTSNDVPCFFIHKHIHPTLLHQGKLGDIAPTILQWMDIPKPSLMTGVSLFV